MTALSNETVHKLVAAAAGVRHNAHAPYSCFKVGAAVLDEDGGIFTGCNVENASYGLGVCAERNAMAVAVAQGSTSIAGIAVVTSISPPAAPCGACRQVLAEFGDFPVVLANEDGEIVETSVAKLLPLAFGPEDLLR